MARSPSINAPNKIDLRTLQDLVSAIRQRLDAVDAIADKALALQRGSSNTLDISQLQTTMNALSQQVRALNSTVSSLSTGSASARSIYILIESEGADGEDGFFRV